MSKHSGTHSLLKVEKENFDPETKAQWEIYCYSIASKRYAPFRLDDAGEPVLLGSPGKYKRSEHGLGHLLDPTKDAEADQQPFRDEWWRLLLCDELGIPRERPVWFDRPAIGRLAISSRHEERTFSTYNQGKAYGKQVRPSNFAIMVFLRARQAGIEGALVAPLESDSRKWSRLRWWWRGHPDQPPTKIRTGDAAYPLAGTTVVKSYRDMYGEYAEHPEVKAAAPDGSPSGAQTRGLLQPRRVAVKALLRIGKEANRLADTEDVVDGPEDQPVAYEPRPCPGCGQPVTGRRTWCRPACAKAAARRSNRTVGNS